MPRGRLIRACCTWALLALTLAIFAVWLLSGWYRFFFYGPAPGSYIDGKIEAGRLEAVIIYPVESSFIHPSFGAMERPHSHLQAVDELRLASPTRRFYWWGRWWTTEERQASLRQTYMTAYLEAPLWPFIVALLTIGAAPSALRWRRRRAGRCTSCGYNRRGIHKDAPCPECGDPQIQPPTLTARSPA